jgi:hypothetical protein
MSPPWEEFNRDFSIDEVLERDDEHRSETRTKNRSYDTLFYIDKTGPHLVQSKFESMGIHRLPHHPDCPDIAPCDFGLFGYVKVKLKKMLLDAPAALLAAVEKIV